MPETPPPWPITSIDLWLGNEITRHAGQVLAGTKNESSYSYFSRWIAIKRFRLEWRVETNPAAPPGKQTFYRPMINGCQLPASFCGQGEDEGIAKEEACKSLVKAIECKL